MTKAEEKRTLRTAIRALEKTLPAAYKAQSSAAIARCVLSLPEYRAAGTVFCFVGTAHEIDTAAILKDALQSGKRLCVPLCVGDGLMELRQITSLDQLAPGAYGIQEPPADSPVIGPDSVDFAVLPCVSCSHSGHRLGQGGGYYDRFLARYPGGAVLVCRERLVREDIPLESHDCPVPWVITERGLWEDGIPARLE